MTLGVFYGIGVGPGDPGLLTVRAAQILSQCRHVFVPKARIADDSLALSIAQNHLRKDAVVHEIVFPMSKDQSVLAAHWESNGREVAAVLREGIDACFLTIGDPMLYSTYIYLLRAVRRHLPDLQPITIPGVPAFAAAAALAHFPIGEAQAPVVIVPSTGDLSLIERSLAMGATVVIMKIGKHLREVLMLLDKAGALGRSVLVSRAGLPDQRIETDLVSLLASGAEAEYLSTILVPAASPEVERKT